MGIWTDEAVDQLRRLRAEGASCSEIGRVLGATRNAVIGKLHRLGIETPPHMAPRYKPSSRRPRAPRAPRPVVRPRPTFIALDPIPVVEQPKPPEFLGVSLLDLTRDHCRYSPNAEPPFLFCGQPVKPGKSWCAYCCTLVFTKPVRISEEDRQRRAAHTRRQFGIRSPVEAA